MTLDQIRLFVAVYRSRSFAAVARELDMAPSSVSRAVAALEDQLQARLFQRTTRNLSPTQLGEQYFHRVEALLEELELAGQEVVSQQAEPFGTLRVSASTSFGEAVLAPLLKDFYLQYPKIRLQLRLTDHQINLVEEQCDIAIRHGRLQDSNLIARKLRDVRYRLVASPDYLAGNPAIKQPQDISHHTIISFEYSPFDKVWKFRRASNNSPAASSSIDEQSVVIEPALTTTTASTIKRCVTSGMGIALLPDWIVENELKQQQLTKLLPEWQIAAADFDTAVWLLYPSKRFVPAKTTALIDYLQQHMS